MDAWNEPLARFERHLSEAGLAGGTVAGYVRDIRAFVRWLEMETGHPVSPGGFSVDDVEAYRRHQHGLMGRSAATVNRTLQSLRKFGRFAVAQEWRQDNPAQEVSLLEPPAGETSSLDAEEVQRLLRAVQERDAGSAKRDRAILTVLLYTGIRVSELAQLSVEDLRLGEAEDNRSTLTVVGRGRQVTRQLPLNEASRRAVEAYLQEPRSDSSSRLFLSRGGQPLSLRAVQQIVTGLGEEAGLELSARTLRNTYARTVWEQTGDLGLLVERLGHRRPESALKYIMPLRHTESSTEVLEGGISG